MSGSKILQDIRNQVANKQACKLCDFCSHPLTIEQTKYFNTEVCELCLQHAKIIDLHTCCNKPSFSNRKLITSAGTIQVREQCENCGFVKVNSLGGFTEEVRKALPEINREAREARQSFYSDMYKEFYSQINSKRESLRLSRRDQIRNNWFKDYNVYLQSTEWKKKREQVLKRDNYLCQACLVNAATQVHHKSYEFVDLNGSEPCFDLVAICPPCHERIEKMKEEHRKSSNP